ncbi:MAG: aminodeoxychorismate synthase component I [Candidatus Latescibacteria bacterium]|nr:aminodeoxychorismate synthase component I [Candidatus Latescibacterota bacterium]
MSSAIFLDRWVEPVALFRHLVRGPHPFWLDSSLLSGRTGRFSFMGVAPFLILRFRDGQTELIRGSDVRRIDQDPLDALADILKTHRAPSPPGETIPFCGGGVGYLGYDLGRLFERLPARPPDDLGLPDLYVAFYGAGVVFDHEAGRVCVCGPSGDAVRDLCRRVETVRPEEEEAFSCAQEPPASSFSREGYTEAVRRVKDYIAAGDVYQVNLSQRFLARLPTGAPDLYLRLRRHSPAPFSAYLDLGDAQILSSSPERFLRVEGRDRTVETRPIKGTRPRGETGEEDRRLASELMASEKDRAELVMIVDLERNDLGRVCRFGSVRAPELAVLEPYADVFHLVATVTGELAPDRNVTDLLRATFPGGSITGAPKVRAMEIIDELEPVSRGPYTGSLGYFSFSGDVDLNILIRTLVVKGDRVCFHAGGGIVADSDPEAEYEETLHKARGMMKALEATAEP